MYLIKKMLAIGTGNFFRWFSGQYKFWHFTPVNSNAVPTADPIVMKQQNLSI